MRQCWSEGDLRAWLDGELAATEMELISGHLAECPACAKAVGALRLRASRVSALMGELAEPTFAENLIAFPAPKAPRRVRFAPWGWVAAAAACFMVAVLALRGTAPQPLAPTPAANPVAPVLQPAERAQEAPAASAPRLLPKPQAQPAPAAPAPARRPDVQYFLALDDAPIDSGVVMRVALGPAQAPADVLYGLDGRARAVRLVSDSISGGRE